MSEDVCSPMLKDLKSSWERFKEGETGHRFRDCYHRRQEQRHSRFALSRLLYVAGGVVVMLAGVVLMPAPGPGWFVFFFGLGLLGSEFLPVARFMDRSEVRLRAVWARGQQMWARAPLAGKLALGAVMIATAGAVSYGLYWLAFRSGL